MGEIWLVDGTGRHSTLFSDHDLYHRSLSGEFIVPSGGTANLRPMAWTSSSGGGVGRQAAAGSGRATTIDYGGIRQVVSIAATSRTMTKVVTAAEAVARIADRSTVTVSRHRGFRCPDHVRQRPSASASRRRGIHGT
ncbi:MAG: hypothetical protein R3D03_01230 [Geminicoccaceae bacterium]